MLGIGRAARFASRSLARPGVAKGVIGGSALLGVASGVLDDEGPYPRVQEQMFGSSKALKYSLKSGAMYGVSPRQHDLMGGYERYYYGRPVNMSSRRNVPGETVFGMYNSRRA